MQLIGCKRSKPRTSRLSSNITTNSTFVDQPRRAHLDARKPAQTRTILFPRSDLLFSHAVTIPMDTSTRTETRHARTKSTTLQVNQKKNIQELALLTITGPPRRLHLRAWPGRTRPRSPSHSPQRRDLQPLRLPHQNSSVQN